jgi:N-acetyl-gamma-glutamyl-phosphate/LysW-gamma-L-alpha-aminoadipyl-6-phosphate reductase
MAKLIEAGIIGATGYTGLSLLEVLVRHPNLELKFATTRRGDLAGEYVYREHPNLLGLTELQFSLFDLGNESLRDANERVLRLIGDSDVVFLAVPSGASANIVKEIRSLGAKIIDTSADFRLKDPEVYRRFYEREHPCPELLKEFVYGLPELHREEIRKAKYVACPGCNSTAMILAGYPLTKIEGLGRFRIVYDIMTGSSEAGAELSRASHHAERTGVVRPYSPKEHRHLAEVRQELGLEPSRVSATMFAVGMVRGVECIGHVFMDQPIGERELWRAFRNAYGNEPFIRIRARKVPGPGSLPDPKFVRGSNYCDVGFFVDEVGGRISVLSALDNLLKGDVGNAVQSMNLMCGLDEGTRLKDLVPSYLYE